MSGAAPRSLEERCTTCGRDALVHPFLAFHEFRSAAGRTKAGVWDPPNPKRNAGEDTGGPRTSSPQAAAPAVNPSSAENPGCLPNVSVRLQPMFEKGMWCHTHVRPLRACQEIARLRAEVARLQAEFGRLFSDFKTASLELDARDGAHTWNVVAETVEGWREYDKVRLQLEGAAPEESKEQDRKEASRALAKAAGRILADHPDAGVK